MSGEIGDVLYRFGSAKFAVGEDIKEPEGEGIWLLLASDRPLAWVNLRDEVRSGSSSLLRWLRRHGYGYSMLTGDSSTEAQRVAELLSIDSFESRATPLQKMNAIQKAQTKSDIVMMVGDGVNDAAAMGVATASIAISPVDTVVQEAAEATLMKADISKLAGLLGYSKKVTRVIRQNIFWAVAYNLLLIPLAVAGYLEPWQAALGMSFSSLFVVLNATRLRSVPQVNL
ncbi:MAG: HAD-IC family P-type ATPase [Pseudomonadales bacterium]|nr:HAD-IC family P-type ATPase [Pseudomonadales bacterium]MDG1444253.1 HAD-IC family P-type ATPase [Pseudomonadales bacterium]